MMKNICLLGFMGSGKTSAGRILAGKMKLPFSDTDLIVKKLSGLAPAAFIRERGFGAWRKAERAAFRAAAGGGGRVIALGGGIMPVKALKPLFKRAGVTVYLECGEKELFRRLSRGPGKRPLLGGSPENAGRAISRLMKKRRRFYEKADLTVDVSKLTPAQTAGKIKKLCRKKL